MDSPQSKHYDNGFTSGVSYTENRLHYPEPDDKEGEKEWLRGWRDGRRYREDLGDGRPEADGINSWSAEY